MRKRRLLGVLFLITSLIIVSLPVTEANAAPNASDFQIEGNKLIKYKGTSKDVSIPSEVEVIAEGAFDDNTKIESLIIPNTITGIEPYAFWGCDSLNTITIGSGLKEIGDFAFAGCKGLKEITIPRTTVSIGIQSFADCVNMTKINIPFETVSIHDSAFDGCAKLKINCDEGSYADSYAKKFYERQKEMPEYEDIPQYNPSPTPTPTPTPPPSDAEDADVLGSTSIVGNHAFVIVDKNDMHVYDGAPAETPEPEDEEHESNLSNSVISVSGRGFQKYAISEEKIIADQAFYLSDKLNGVVYLPKTIKEIGQFSFARSNISGIECNAGLETIAFGAFYHCDALETVTLPNTVMNVEPNAFQNTAWLNNFKKSPEEFLISGGVLVAYNGNEPRVTIPDGVRVIAAGAFANHEEIRGVWLPDSLEVVCEGAFENCNKLMKVEFGNKIHTIKDRAFAGCELLKEIELPTTVKNLGLNVFGAATVDYKGNIPTWTYENSASRLSNEAYRGLSDSSTQKGSISVVGLPNAAAKLEGAGRPYYLTLKTRQETSDFEKVWADATAVSYPNDKCFTYSMTLTDESTIPITKLGKNTLTIIIEVPETFRGKKLEVVQLDRNGQIQALDSETVKYENIESLCIRTKYVSDIMIYDTDASLGDEIRIFDSEMLALSARPEEDSLPALVIVKYVIGFMTMFFGLFLIFFNKQKRTKYENV